MVAFEERENQRFIKCGSALQSGWLVKSSLTNLKYKTKLDTVEGRLTHKSIDQNQPKISDFS